MRILLIEDDAFKAKRISTFFGGMFADEYLEIARSVSAGLSRMIAPPKLDGILLDMSLSTFDVGPTEPGGRPQNFGGIAVLEHMLRREISTPVLIVTQFETFPKDGIDLSLRDLREELKLKYPGVFVGLVYYSSRESEWEHEVQEFLQTIKVK